MKNVVEQASLLLAQAKAKNEIPRSIEVHGHEDKHGGFTAMLFVTDTLKIMPISIWLAV